ncbi:SH3 domain-containing protein [Leisingera aquaemixtae]|uniref:SH3 domain-containing protein n=1 Tax=Leisingera aquaemixtae TaxID=1396826 RepID=UPI0021A29033|nr:SH3 domain-containing protein [Leisingera aquaemixtae]UWQ35904.1 SH3 domain-containing protein [Leisingera aquaemixtae]
METLNIALDLLRDVPAQFRILGIVVVTLVASLPLFRPTHPAYLLSAFVSLQFFVAFLLPGIVLPSEDEKKVWLRDDHLRCVLVSGLNPDGDHNLAVRNGPGTEFEEITQRYTHQKLWVHGETMDWVQVRFIEKGQQVEGWVHRFYTTNTSCS